MKKFKTIFSKKKLSIILGAILGIFVAIFIFGAVFNSFSGGDVIKVVSAQSVFQSSENPQFIFEYKKQASIFSKMFASVKDFFGNKAVEISTTVKIIDANNQEVSGLDPKITQDSSGGFAVELNHSHFQQEIRPGKYTMKFEIKDGDKTYLQEQEFVWGVLAINTNKSIYVPGEEAYLQFAVLNEKGGTICDAKLKLKIKNQKSKSEAELTTENGGIKYSGKCFGDNVIDIPDYFAHYRVDGPGKYEMKLTNLDNGFEISDYFEVRETVEFDIERIGPTRIWPQADYEMRIKIRANQDFEGEIIETVPMTFALTLRDGTNPDQSPNIDNYTKVITWQMKLKKGETKEIVYTFDAPDISPYFYLIGPLRLVDTRSGQAIIFTESREWQIASDAISYLGNTQNNSANGANTALSLSGLGLQENDLVIIAYNLADNDNVNFDLSENSGTWTEVADLFANDTYDTNLGVFYKIMGSSPDLSVTVVGGCGTDCDTSVVGMAFRGVDPSSPMDVAGVGITGLDTMHPNPPAIDHNNPSGVYTAIAIANSNGTIGNQTFTFPEGYTTNAVQQPSDDTCDGIVGMGYRSSGIVDPENPEMASASGTNSTSYSWAAVTMALKPAQWIISGTCYLANQTSTCANDLTVKAAVNGTLDSASGTTSGGSWSITLASTTPAAGNPITVFIDGAGDANEAVAVTKWVSGSTLSGVVLYQMHLNIGHTGGAQTITNANISVYDYSVSGDEDVFHEASATSLEVCRISGCESAELYIVAGNTFQPNSSGSSYVETHDIEIDGTFDTTGSGNYASISGSWNDDGIFTYNTSTIFFVASDSAEIVSTSALTEVFYNVQFGDSSTTSYTGQWSLNQGGAAFQSNNGLVIDAGTVIVTGSGTDDSRPLIRNGTLSAGSNSLVKFTGTSNTTVQTGTYYNLELSPSGGSNPTYTLGRTIGDSNGTAYKINDASNFGSLPGAGRQLVRTSTGLLYVAVNDGTYVEVWSSTDGSSWTQQDSGDSPAGDQADGVSMAIDSSNVLHIIYVVSGDLKYVTFDTFTNQFGTPENAVSNANYNITGHDIAIDSYGKPHVVYFYNTISPVKYYIDYTNKVGVSWKSAVNIMNTNGDSWLSCSIAIDSSDLPVIAHILTDYTSFYAAIGNQNNATSFTSTNPDTTVAQSNTASSIGIDTAGNVWIAYVDVTTNYVALARHDAAEAWTTGWTSYNNTNVGSEPSIAIKGTKVYVFYTNDANDIAYDTYDGSSWLGETDLAVGTYQDVHVKWSYYFNNQGSLRIGYLYSDNTDVYWNALTLGAESTGALSCNNLTIGDGVNAVTVTANTNDPDIDVGGNVTISSGAIFTASDSGALNVAGDWTNSSGTFNHSSATVIFDAGSSGKNINNGSSSFYNISFSNSSGGWTLQGTMTVVANFNILDGAVTLTSGTLNIGGNFSNTNSRTFDHNSGTVNLYSTISRNLESGCADASTCTNQDFYNLIINKTAVADADDNVTLTDHLRVANALTLTDGQLFQGNYNVLVSGASAVSVAAAAEWTNIGTGDLTLGGTFANAGSVSFDTNDSDCEPTTDDIQILSTSGGSQRTWSGTGSFEMYNIYVQDMTRSDSPNITVYSGTYSNVTGNWTFSSCTVLEQAHFRWRDDNNGETNADWLAGEDAAHSSQARSENVRLRFVITNTGSTATTSRNYVLQVAPLGTYGYCEAVPSASYSDVSTTSGGCGSSVACMTASGNFIDQATTTPQLTAEGTWVDGKMVEDPSNQSDGVIINSNYYTEHEYNFQFTSNAVNNTNYCFRVTKNGILLDSYTKVAEITIESTGTENNLLNRLRGSIRILGRTLFR